MGDGRAVTICRTEDLERTGKWLLVRRSLGLRSFGMNMVELGPGEDIPEHDETERDQEEVFIVLRGSPTMVVDGREHPAPAGTLVRLDPAPSRTIVNHGSEPATVLIVSAPRSSGYEPLEWA
ncbi:MAG TPA: cupin domain-containing protein [Solirubrobacteraceae bacterium]|nr:cupin domain-containing protein [Solirubrobacteraceae bacterium]